MIKLIEKIEGEATLDFQFHEDKIDFVDIAFTNSRGIEQILENKPALDALVINPRVCGICGHAHLIATVKALEDCYENIEVSNKAKIVRDLTLNFELIQNHFKWLYLVIYPLLGKKQNVLKAVTASQMMGKAIAILGGQYPHNSYAIPGGVTSTVLPSDIIKVENYIMQTIRFFKKNLVHVDIEKFLLCENIDNLFSKHGQLPELVGLLLQDGFAEVGKSYDQFIVFGDNGYFSAGKSLKTRVQKNADIKYVQEFNNLHSKAKNVMYKNQFYEVGPLSRAMITKTPLIKDVHRRYTDSALSRILARICEIPQLLHHSLALLKQIDYDEPSYIKPKQAIEEITGYGETAVEAARGSLIHKVQLNEGIINKYEIITPTQWNLSNGTKEYPGIAQKAMIGQKNINRAELIFKSFDVCSVCTTQ